MTTTSPDYEAALTEAYHVAFDVKDAHSDPENPGAGLDSTDEQIRYTAYLTCQQIENLMERLGYTPPSRFDGQGRPPAPMTARFQGQAWVKDNALDVDDSECEWDCTTAFYELDPEYRAHMLTELHFHDEVLDRDDALISDPNAPDMVQNWNGPFSIHVRPA